MGNAWALQACMIKPRSVRVLGLAPQEPLNGNDRIAEDSSISPTDRNNRRFVAKWVRNDTLPPPGGIFLSGTARANSNSLFAPWGSPSLLRPIFCREQRVPTFIRKVNSPVSQEQFPSVEDQVTNPRPAFELLLNLIGPRQITAQLPVPGKNHLQRVG